MYLWKVDNLIVDLKKGLNEMEQLKYLIVYMLLSYIVMYFPVENNIYDYIIITIEISISIITLLVCFIINGGKEGLGFVSKYLSLGFVALIRYYVIVSIFFVIIILLSPPGEMINETSTLQNVFVNGGLFIGYSCLVIIYFKKLNKTEK